MENNIIDKYNQTKKAVLSAADNLEDLTSTINTLRSQFQEQIVNKVEEVKFANFDIAQLNTFFSEPYVIMPKKQDEWYVIAPRFINFNIGWLERSTKAYNVFIVNKYMNWLSEIPKELKDKFNFKKPLPLHVEEGMVETPGKTQDEAWSRYSKHLLRKEGSDKIRIKQGHEFHLLADMINDGIMPFKPRPISKEDLRELHPNLKLRDYQQIALDDFRKLGAIGVYWPTGAGKTFIGLSACSIIKGSKAIIVPSTTLREQWEERIYKYIPEYVGEIEVHTYAAYEKLRNREFALVIFDESHRLPANTFSRLATMRMKYRMGLSATPYREDGRTDYIFALTGFPIGMDWTQLIEKGFIKPPDVTLYVVEDRAKKTTRLKDLLKSQEKTLVFCDSLDYGNTLSRLLNVPFVHGDTNNRMDILRKNNHVIISRVGDEGVSLPDIQRVIEVDFQYGSRRQESQRMGRLMHSEKADTNHVIIMTEQELNDYEKRLYAIKEKGIKITIVR